MFPAVINWRQGKKDREYEDLWEPPTDFDIIMQMDKIGFKKIKLFDQTLVKSVKGQMIDVNAIAKGWGVDKIFDYLEINGIARFMVEVGGEIKVLGLNNKGQKWKIGIDKPMHINNPGENIIGEVVKLKDQAMATSGNYRNFLEFNGKKYSHIIDPKNGKSIFSNISSVSVVAPNCLDADVLATALNVLSYEDGLNLIESLKGYEALWIVDIGENNLEVKTSSGMPVM